MRSALITGASRGIGRAIALDLAAQGFGLTVSARNPETLEAFADEARAAGSPQVVAVPADLAERDLLAGVVAAHGETFGTMDALIHSGGVGTAGLIADIPLRRVDKIMAINLTSTFELVQPSIPLLRAAAETSPFGARVILLSSITGVYAEAQLAAYGASKAALVSLAETLNLEESGNGVMATAIAPGYVDTDMSDWTKDSIAAEGMITVDDVAGVVRMLVGLGKTTSITKIVMTRSGSSGYEA